MNNNESPERPALRRRRWFQVLVAALLLILVIVLLWDWNWFKPLVERRASAALGREVTLQHFDVDLARHPLVVADGIAIANPEEFPAGSKLGSIERLAVKLDLWSLVKGPLQLDSIEIDKPLGDLGPGPSGTPNYRFEALMSKDEDDTESEPPGVQIGQLIVRDGDIRIVEPAFKADFRLRIKTLEPEGDNGEQRIRIDASGRYADAPIEGRFIGGSVLSLRDPSRPYPVDLRAKNGDTEVSLQGTVLDPIRLGGAKLKLDFSGANLADLYPLTGVPLPPSPPYKLSGAFDYGESKFRFRNFKGLVGQSDIAGDATVNPAGEQRRRVTIVAQSQRVVWQDLAGLIGATPGDPDSPRETTEQKADRSRKAATGKLLPDTPIALPRLRAADLDVQYKVAKIESDITPVDNLDMHVIIEQGLLTVKPLKLGVGSGSIVANLSLDGRKDRVHTVADIDFRKLDLGRIMQKVSAFSGVGTIGGNARIEGRGNSLADMLGAGDGELRLFMTEGDISALLVNLAGLDFGNALISALGLPSKAHLNCMVADLGLEKGQLKTRTLLADTTEANIIGSGSVNLATEAIDYTIKTEPKRPNIGRLNAPIDIKGQLRNPSIFPDKSQLAARGGAAVLFGAVLGPLAALIPTIQLGLGEDNDCVALLKSVDAPAKASAPPAQVSPNPKRGAP